MSKQDISFINKIDRRKSDDTKVKLILDYLEATYANEDTLASKTSILKRLAVNRKVMKKEENYSKITNKELYQKLIDNRRYPDTREIGKFKINILLTKKYLKDPEELFIFLLFASGRRPSEILMKDNFFIQNDAIAGDAKLYIRKILKKRQKANPDGYELILIPEVSPKVFLDIYEEFHKINKFAFETIRKKAAVILKEDMATDEFAVGIPDFKVKDLRPLYLDYNLQFNPRYKNLNVCISTQNLLVHENMGCVASYLSKFRIVE